MNTRYLFWAVVLGVVTILAANFVSAVISNRAGYKRAVEKFGGHTNG